MAEENKTKTSPAEFLRQVRTAPPGIYRRGPTRHRRKDGTMTTESVVMRASSGTVRWIKGEHRID